MQKDSTRTSPQGIAGPGDHVLLTGGTGFLGTEIMKRILRHHPRTHLSLLVRSTHREQARERVERLLVRVFGVEEAARLRSRVDIVEGDISLRGAGMDSERRAKIQPKIDHVIHCAASVRFDLPLEIARRDNTEGTRNMLTFAEGCPKLGRFDYIGTAFIAGNRRGLIKEDELDMGQDFSNSYERTKLESEKLVRAFAEKHPTTIFRPSVVVGDSKNGETSTFQGFYQALLFYRQLYSKKIVVLVPADPNTPVDIIPVDYVVDALFAIMANPKSIGGCFHLTSGPGYTCTFDELMQITAKFTGIKAPPYVPKSFYTKLLRPLLRSLVWDKRRDVMLKAETYFPYAWSRLHFDKTKTNEILAGTGVKTPHPRDYFIKLLEYQQRALKLG